MANLTSVQKKTLDFILEQIEKTGMPPTLREIALHFQWKAVGSAQDVVNALRKKGVLLSPSPGKSRQIVPSPELLSDSFRESSLQSTLTVPLIGMVQAGNPIEVLEESRETVSFPLVSRSLLKGGSLFALKVEGYSMLLAGFLPGDTILVEASSSAKDREIVVAKTNRNEVTVKRFAQKGSWLYHAAQKENKIPQPPPAYLIPENPDFDPIPFGLDEEDKIIGIVRSLYRSQVA